MSWRARMCRGLRSDGRGTRSRLLPETCRGAGEGEREGEEVEAVVDMAVVEETIAGDGAGAIRTVAEEGGRAEAAETLRMMAAEATAGEGVLAAGIGEGAAAEGAVDMESAAMRRKSMGSRKLRMGTPIRSLPRASKAREVLALGRIRHGIPTVRRRATRRREAAGVDLPGRGQHGRRRWQRPQRPFLTRSLPIPPS